jgi:hypothetical protein
MKRRALGRGTIDFLDGEPVSAVTWTGEPHVYRVECGDCKAVAWESPDCPLCGAAGRLRQALDGKNRIAPPRQCPRCDYAELTLTVELRLRVETVLGRVSRKVAEAEAHEGGFHVVEARCKSCEEIVAAAGEAACVACGRSNLLRMRK